MILSYRDVSFPFSECTARHWKSASPAKEQTCHLKKTTSSVQLVYWKRRTIQQTFKKIAHWVESTSNEKYYPGYPNILWLWNIPKLHTHTRTSKSNLEICTLFLWLRVHPFGSQRRWGRFFSPAVAPLGGGCWMGTGFHTESDRKDPEVGNAAQAAGWDERRSAEWIRNIDRCQMMKTRMVPAFPFDLI